ncbi:RNA-directed DNA polymerase, eukaryota [Tanacetum coccineum]
MFLASLSGSDIDSCFTRSLTQELIQPLEKPERESLLKKKKIMTELTLEESLRKFMIEFAKRHDENSNLIKEIRAPTNAAFKIQEASIKALEFQVRELSMILNERISGNLQSSIENKPRVNDETISISVKTHVLRDLAPIKLTIDLADRTVKHLIGIAKNVLVRIDKFDFPIDFIILDIPKDSKTSLILGIPFLSTANAIINIIKAKITLRVRNRKRN